MSAHRLTSAAVRARSRLSPYAILIAVLIGLGNAAIAFHRELTALLDGAF